MIHCNCDDPAQRGSTALDQLAGCRNNHTERDIARTSNICMGVMIERITTRVVTSCITIQLLGTMQQCRQHIPTHCHTDPLTPRLSTAAYDRLLVYLVTALVPSDTACLASSPGSSSLMAVWISRLLSVERLL